MRLRATLLLAGLAACGSLADAGPPGAVKDLPWRDGASDATVLTARILVEQGRPREALTMVEAVLSREPRHVDALRLRQDILRERGRRGLLLHEAEHAVAATPNDAIALYLQGRVVPDTAQKLANFERAAELEPASMWPWLGLAHTLRVTDVPRSLEIYRRLYDATEGHPLVAVAYAAMLRDTDHDEQAIAVYRRLQGNDRVPGVGDLGLAQTWLAADRRADAWPALLAALRQRPFDPGVQSLLRGWLGSGASPDQVAQVFDVLREDPTRVRSLADGDGEGLLADLLLRTQQPAAALGLLESSATDARRPALRRLQRRLLLGVGDVAGFLHLVRSDLPESIVGAETNLVRARWLTLLRGPWHEHGGVSSPDEGVALLEALRSVGWLTEVELLAETIARRWPAERTRFDVLRDEARTELAFEGGLRRLLYHGYEGSDRTGLDGLLERIRALSLQVLKRDVVGEPPVFSIPLVGELVDPFEGRLAQHFDRYNRHFILGRRAGGTVEGMLFVRLSSAELPSMPDLPLPGRCYEVIAIDRDVRALAGVLGGDVAGVALLNHFLVDYDAVREWARSLADRRRTAAEDGNALTKDPLPSDVGLDPLDVAWRLAVASPLPDGELDLAVLDTIRHHERQHLVDAFHFLPVEENLWRSLGLLFSFGLSPSAIESEMERRAELAALAVSEHTELVLAHIADFLGDPNVRSPHHQGFGALGAEITAELRSLGVAAADAVPSRWHTVDRVLVRTAARRLLSRL